MNNNALSLGLGVYVEDRSSDARVKLSNVDRVYFCTEYGEFSAELMNGKLFVQEIQNKILATTGSTSSSTYITAEE